MDLWRFSQPAHQPVHSHAHCAQPKCYVVWNRVPIRKFWNRVLSYYRISDVPAPAESVGKKRDILFALSYCVPGNPDPHRQPGGADVRHESADSRFHQLAGRKSKTSASRQKRIAVDARPGSHRTLLSGSVFASGRTRTGTIALSAR